jgi:hypothetical protein
MRLRCVGVFYSRIDLLLEILVCGREWERYDYPVSSMNDYYRSILERSLQGWPGGLRWLHEEDKP